MTKRSLFLIVAAGLLASVAFATPSQAAPTTITTTLSFSVSGGGTANDFSVTYSPSVDPITPNPPTIVSTGGLTHLVLSEAGSVVTGTFDAAGSSGSVQFQFATGSIPSVVTASLSGVPSGDTGTLNFGVSPLVIPEPASMALLGIGMTGLLAFRRMFKRFSAA